MKKIILSVVVAAFAVAVQAGNDSACAEKAAAGACCAAKKATTEPKAEVKACPTAGKQANATCTKSKSSGKIAKQQLKSPKAAS